MVGVNSFQSPKHTAVILQRGTWGLGDKVPDYLVSHVNDGFGVRSLTTLWHSFCTNKVYSAHLLFCSVPHA